MQIEPLKLEGGYYLLQLKDNYADEFDIHFSMLVEREFWDDFVDRVTPYDNEGGEFYFGTNEYLELDAPLLGNIRVHEITDLFAHDYRRLGCQHSGVIDNIIETLEGEYDADQLEISFSLFTEKVQSLPQDQKDLLVQHENELQKTKSMYEFNRRGSLEEIRVHNDTIESLSKEIERKIVALHNELDLPLRPDGRYFLAKDLL